MLPNAKDQGLTLEMLWDLRNFKPNKEQEEAIRHIHGPLFLTAGPGSGKTRVLLWRTVNLIVFEQINPEEIFLSTFTEKAAQQLRDGLRSLLGMVTNLTDLPYDISKMALGTVHSICNTLTIDRRFSTDGSRNTAPHLMDELDQYFKIYGRRFWNELIAAGGYPDEDTAAEAITAYLGTYASKSRHNAVTGLIALFNRFSEECLNPAAVSTIDPDLLRILKMYQYYCDALSRDRIKTVDFALLQQSAFNILNNFPDAHNVFKHIIIDEYQDTNTIQEKIFFGLAGGTKNICVVGDDDQALYRFRGATVENLVEFEDRCKTYLNTPVNRINLNTNYRSKKQIVDCYTSFIDRIDWSKQNGTGYHRVTDKKIKANQTEEETAVIKSSWNHAQDVYQEIAQFVHELKQNGKIQDFNQVAFLFPAMKGITKVDGLKNALEQQGIPVYAPRAGRFLEVDEATAIYGLFFKIFGRPKFGRGSRSQGLREFNHWIDNAELVASQLCTEDSFLDKFIKDKQTEIKTVLNDFAILSEVIKKKRWQLDDPFTPEMIRDLIAPAGLSSGARKNLSNSFFLRIVRKRIAEGTPFTVKYILFRTTSLDWTILDLFYRLNAFAHFRKMYRLAQDGTDEGPVCNLGLITQYLARFMDTYSSIITASFLQEDRFVNTFFGSFTYALFRRAESEYEDAQDPFPKGRVPFLTIHQSKGLEFPVVVLGSIFKQNRKPAQSEIIIRDLLSKTGEPLDRMNEFDNMRMFYVALSRAQNLLILPHYKGGSAATEPFKQLFDVKHFQKIEDFEIATLANAKTKDEDLGKNYSFTGDYLNFRKCPRQYMIFRKYGFVPSRSQTMVFGSLVHQTIEDLHHLLIAQRKNGVSQ